ncbi:class I heat shock protein-like [Macadamia integrifolia]|uniref:class I heat shock protein-like n=1 Tax=Macadamia integrifolia TaxID=60698 RepID=UPI001C4F3DE6|nr:class I heat shock protein-like [Macadamia integrifolia]
MRERERDRTTESPLRLYQNHLLTFHVFTVDLPRLNKEEIKIVIDGNVIQISGERRKEGEEKNSLWHKLEHTFGNFLNRFRLPENMKKDQVKANMQSGVLTMIVPKQEVKKPQAKRIEIAG